eukprot:jgi/Ulvmu1/11961/UM082_0040.1
MIGTLQVFNRASVVHLQLCSSVLASLLTGTQLSIGMVSAKRSPATSRSGFQAESGEAELGSCAWLEDAQTCIEAPHGLGGADYALFTRQVKECPFASGPGKCPADALPMCRDIEVTGTAGEFVCGPACAPAYESLVPFIPDAGKPSSYEVLLGKSSEAAASERTLYVLGAACSPLAVLPVAAPGAIGTSCRAATTRAACAAASGPGGLVEPGAGGAAPLPPPEQVVYALHIHSEGDSAEAEDEDDEDAVSVHMGVHEVEVRTTAGRAAGAECIWDEVFPGGEGICVAGVAGVSRERLHEVNEQNAICMSDNAYAPGTEDLVGCQAGHAFCKSLPLAEAPGSKSCVLASTASATEHLGWFIHYLLCSGPVLPEFEPFCELARSSFYKNLGCSECAAAAAAAAPHQPLCATATSELACQQLNAALQE